MSLLVLTSLSVHSNESLVWLEAPGFCYTVDGALTGTHPVIALCLEDFAALGLQDWPFNML